ncbi:MAG TPA: glycosyltransferase [Bryobacteraceae bacterium]|nr:glycosyltransferase [Bryobacteraceae bacterium]
MLWEFPISTCSYLGLAFPISGGNYVRQFPPPLVRRLLDNWNRRYSVPFVMYFHAWELDPEQVRIEASSPLVKIRHYRNLDRMYSILQDYFSRYQFTGIAEYLREDPEAASAMDRKQAAAQTEVRVRQSVPQSREPVRQQSKIPVSIVVPCYNEELIVPYLSNTLQSVQARLAHYDLRFILVDDCSTDNTWKVLGEAFGHRTNYVLVRQPVNGGVAAAILAGIRCAGTEIVCSMDCDCTYDPHELSAMIPLLTPETDLVTASPYHPLGGVRNVPKWRLTLSKTASRLYGLTLRHKLFTYTSCFRVYRRSSVMHMQLRNGRFIGVAEILGRLDLQGSRIVEHPCVLQVRLIGRSKMKTAAAVAGHLGLIGWLLKQRVQRQSAAGTPQSSAVPKAAEPSL